MDEPVDVEKLSVTQTQTYSYLLSMARLVATQTRQTKSNGLQGEVTHCRAKHHETGLKPQEGLTPLPTLMKGQISMSAPRFPLHQRTTERLNTEYRMLKKLYK